MAFVSLYESFLLYCSLLLIMRYIYSYQYRIVLLVCSYVAFCPLIIIAFINDQSFYNLFYLFFLVSQFILIKFTFPKTKLLHITSAYVFLYCINVLLTAAITTLIPVYNIEIDLIICTANAILCAYVCLSKVRCKIQQFIAWTPKYVLIVTLLLLISSSFLSVLISGYASTAYKTIWGRYLEFAMIALLFAICVVLPIFVFHSISNNRLRALTDKYEHQIQVQAAHYESLANANFEVRRFKHDFKNLYIGLETIIKNGNYDQALSVLNEWCQDMSTSSPSLLQFDTGNGIADALLTDKQKTASAYNTTIIFTGSLPSDWISPTDICVILGNAMDNAIEACQNIELSIPKIIEMNASCSSGFLFLSITNPIAHPISVDNNFIATTKENKTLHGFGLYSLHTIVKKYAGQISIHTAENQFDLDISLCISRTEANQKA